MASTFNVKDWENKEGTTAQTWHTTISGISDHKKCPTKFRRVTDENARARSFGLASKFVALGTPQQQPNPSNKNVAV